VHPHRLPGKWGNETYERGKLAAGLPRLSSPPVLVPSLQPTYLAQLTFGAAELAAIHRLREARGRQDLFLRPEQLNRLRTHAQVESTESSNRIEGIVART